MPTCETAPRHLFFWLKIFFINSTHPGADLVTRSGTKEKGGDRIHDSPPLIGNAVLLLLLVAEFPALLQSAPHLFHRRRSRDACETELHQHSFIADAAMEHSEPDVRIALAEPIEGHYEFE